MVITAPSHSINQEYNIECDGHIFWTTRMEKFYSFCKEHLQKHTFGPYHISVYI